MPNKRVYKKELTKDQLLDTVFDFMEQIGQETATTVILEKLGTMLKEILTASWAKVWLINEEGELLCYGQGELYPKVIPTTGLLAHVLKSYESLLVNLVDEDPRYDSSSDNIHQLPIKDMLLVPVQAIDNRLIMVLQVATFLSDLQQFTHNDLAIVHVIRRYLVKLYAPLINDRLHRQSFIDKAKIDTTIADLEEGKAKAESAVEARTQFLAEVAHEIRTPMNAVMGFIDLLKLDEKDPQKQSYLESASKSGTMMIALINDLLDFSKIEKGMMALEEMEFSPIEEFGSIAPLFCGRMKKGHILFQLFIDPNVPKTVVSDPHRIKQILSNLLGNAIKFTPPEGLISLDITYEPHDKEIIFSVQDNGAGIAKEKQHLIFEAYAQEKVSTAREHGGTGLGLSISMKLVELFGSQLQLESEEGHGARFYFSLPLEGKIYDPAFMFDRSVIAKLRPALIFSESYFPTRKLLLRYLKAFGLAMGDISVLTDWKQTDGLPLTHVFCDANSIETALAQSLLDKGVEIIVMEMNPFSKVTHGLRGNVCTIECTFGPDRLFYAMTRYDGMMIDDWHPVSTTNEIVQLHGRVLVVDDNTINIQFISEVTKKFGLEVYSASDGKHAIQLYIKAMQAKRPYHLILLDEVMPNMSGTETAAFIVNLEKQYNLPHTPMIGISGNATDEQRQKSLKAGMDECMFKPISIKKLSEVFTRYLPKAT